ncbi:MAG TPA: contractile injection system tape measure protein [Thermoanaerobaculia bacterium]
MNATDHIIRKQTLHLTAGSQALALALQPRLGDLNRQRLLPVIERVLDGMDSGDRHVRIGRLEVNLGRLSPADLEGEMERRLERALRRSLEAALRRVGDDPKEDEGVQSREDWRREMLEHCLLYGTLPWWAPRRSLSLEDLFEEMAGEDPEGLVEAVRELGRSRRVLERLAAQLGEAALRRLVRLLEPEHAVLILTYLGDVRQAHRGRPLLPLSEGALGRVLWVLTQAYLVHDPGSPFHRRSFVRSLLRGLAAREGLRYEDLLAALRHGLERTAERGLVRSSLPAVVEELAREAGEDLQDPKDDDDPDETWEDGPPAAFGRALGEICPEEAGILRGLLRILARIPAPYRPRPDSLVRQVIFAEALRFQAGESPGAESFERVLRALFATPLSEPVERALRREGEAWTEHGEAFLAAVTAVSPRTEGKVLSDEDLQRTLLELLACSPHEARDFLLLHRGDRERWAKVLPESALVRIAQILEPRKHRILLDAAEVLAAAWSETAPRQHPDLTDRKTFWSFLLDFLTRPGGQGLSVERLVAAFFEHTAAASPASSRREETGERLLETAGRLARAGGHAVLTTVLRRRRPVLLKSWEDRGTSRKRKRRPLAGKEEAQEEKGVLYVGNAGLALTGPFLPHLFRSLDLLGEEDGKVRLRDDAAVSRAVYLLQFLVDGRTDAPEPELAFNKVLCGVPVSTPVDREIVPTEREREVCGQLLRSMIANWPIISNTSVAGLQETFLRREGRLQSSDDGWKLRVQRKTLDVLVDQVPWSVSVVYHSWMPQPVHVTW